MSGDERMQRPKVEILDDIGVFRELREQVSAAGSQAAWCREHKVVESVLSLALNAHREPSPTILKAMGLRRVVRYVHEDASSPEQDARTRKTETLAVWIDGAEVVCPVVKRLGFNQDTGSFAAVVSHDGAEKMAVKKGRQWRLSSVEPASGEAP
jgi:hypothetical protein